MTGLQKGELDIMDGSPPCPPFSMAGSKREGWNKEKVAYGMKQQNIEDLTWEQIRIAGDLMPKVIVCENVKGLSMDYARDHLNKMVRDFEALGYSVVWKIMKGHEHGVPQKRERVFMVGVRDDVLDAIGRPWMTLGSLFPDASNDYPTIGQAIDDLQDDPENIEDAKYLVRSDGGNISAPVDTSSNALSVKNGELLVDYIYLDTDERRRFAQVSHEYLIEQVQHTGVETTVSGSQKVRLNFNHPVKELIFTGVPTTTINAGANGVTGGSATPGQFCLLYTSPSPRD